MSETPVHLVVIEDEKPIRRFLASALDGDTWGVHEAETG